MDIENNIEKVKPTSAIKVLILIEFIMLLVFTTTSSIFEICIYCIPFIMIDILAYYLIKERKYYLLYILFIALELMCVRLYYNLFGTFSAFFVLIVSLLIGNWILENPEI